MRNDIKGMLVTTISNASMKQRFEVWYLTEWIVGILRVMKSALGPFLFLTSKLPIKILYWIL